MKPVELLKKNGFPITIILKTDEVKTNKYCGFFTEVLDENLNIMYSFYHKELRTRIDWVYEYFELLKW